MIVRPSIGNVSALTLKHIDRLTCNFADVFVLLKSRMSSIVGVVAHRALLICIICAKFLSLSDLSEFGIWGGGDFAC